MNHASGPVDGKFDLERTQRQLLQTQKELTELLYTISHDFRGPLRAIMSSSMILMEDYAPQLDAGATHELKRQSEAARRLNKMLEELLILSRLGRRNVSLERFDIAEMFQSVAADLGLPPEQIRCGPAHFVTADPELIRLLLENVVTNAIRFVRPDSAPHITLSVEDGVILIADQGIGLLPEQASRIFHPFERLNGDAYPGMGMGLTQARRIAAMHDGEISAAGEPGVGLTIRFKLPVVD